MDAMAIFAVEVAFIAFGTVVTVAVPTRVKPVFLFSDSVVSIVEDFVVVVSELEN